MLKLQIHASIGSGARDRTRGIQVITVEPRSCLLEFTYDQHYVDICYQYTVTSIILNIIV
jgi:hypothetical protein